MKNPGRLFVSLLLSLFCTIPVLIAADDPIPTALHIHSHFSSGARSIAEIAELAKKQNVRALILTDLYHEHYEYGLWPFQKIIKKSFDRESIMKRGFQSYLEEIAQASQQTPQVLVIDGTAVTPFYYWSGSPWTGTLILNNRAKDLLVLGMGDVKKYQNLPVLANGKSPFNAYEGDQYSAPYQHLIDHVQKENGLVFWSHPHANEHLAMPKVFMGVNVYLDTPAYQESLLNTFRYHGFGVFSTDLSLIHLPGRKVIASPEGIWDRVLMEYCEGSRKEPAWVIGEVDYNGFPDGIKNLDEILNMVFAEKPSRELILHAIRGGRLYVTIPASHTERLILDEFSLNDGILGKKAGMGDILPLSTAPLIKIKAHLSEESAATLKILLIKNARVIQEWNETLPFDIQYQDSESAETGKSYYRILAYSENSPHRLLTNPIFTERHEN